MRAGVWMAAAGVVLGLSGLAWASTPDEIVATRQAQMKQMGQLGKALKAAANNGADPKTMVAQAQTLATLGQNIAGLFPVGTETAHETEASHFIWSDRAGFEARSTLFATDTAKLVQIAQAGDQPAFAAQWAVVGSQCGACHRNYREQ